MHAPLTPFADGGIDYGCYGRLLDFHLRNGADGLAVPMHVGESVSLTVEERKLLLEFALERVGGQIPVVAHVSEAGTANAASLAQHAAKAGAAALIASVPYYWTPPQSMLIEHFAAIAEAGALPFFVHNNPSEMAEVEFATASVIKLIERAPNFVGLIDSSLDWQYMIEAVQLARDARADFQFVSGTEYMISASAIGATGMVSSLSGVCPHMVRRLYDLCRAEEYPAAREGQATLGKLSRLFARSGVPGLKAAARAMGRDCGDPRPPIPPLARGEAVGLAESLTAADSMHAEPRGWA
ncbi:MAG: dihydrodipicolinate synthase family protein [Candidatus Binataceae bacterium]